MRDAAPAGRRKTAPARRPRRRSWDPETQVHWSDPKPFDRRAFYWKLAAGNIRKNRKIYYPYLLTAVLTAMMLYVISSLSSNQSLGSAVSYTHLTLPTKLEV